VFAGRQGPELGHVIRCVADNGYAGMEMGFRFLRSTPADALQDMLSEAGIQLVATHLGGNLEDLSQAAGEKTMVQETADYLEALGTKRIMYSGLRYTDAATFEADLATLSRSADYLASRGFRLLYHNHAWEFANDWQVMNAVLERTPETLGLCPDVGWVHKAGVDVIPFLERVKTRIGAVHFKEFKTRDQGVLDTTEFGRGIVPLREIAAWLRENLPESWVLAEQDKTELTPEEAIAANAEFLRSLT
jgi:sugar phosphate isomerase/epimerase